MPKELISKFSSSNLLIPSKQYFMKLYQLGIPVGAIRIDFLGVLLPDFSWSYVHSSGKWKCVSMNTLSIEIDADTEVDARAIKLISLLETGQVSLQDTIKRLEAMPV